MFQPGDRVVRKPDYRSEWWQAKIWGDSEPVLIVERVDEKDGIIAFKSFEGIYSPSRFQLAAPLNKTLEDYL